MFVKTFWPSFLWGCIIVFLSSSDGDTIPSSPWMKTLMIDKWVHIFMYFLFYVLIYSGFKKYQSKNKVALGFLISFSFGILMEIFQHYFWINRSGDIFDVLANTFGVLFGVLTADFCLENAIKLQKKIKKQK